MPKMIRMCEPGLKPSILQVPNEIIELFARKIEMNNATSRLSNWIRILNKKFYPHLFLDTSYFTCAKMNT